MNAKQKMQEATLREQQQLADIEEGMEGKEVSNEGFDYTSLVNAPKLKEGMIPITYNETKGEWEVADKSNPNKSWYDYDDKRWANICTVSDSVIEQDGKDYRTAEPGTEISVEKMTTMFVWIPRYAYSIVDGYQNTKTIKDTSASTSPKIEVKFLVGNTNRDIDNKTYKTDYDPTEDLIVVGEGDNKKNTTPMIVHPGFTFGNNQLTGFWMAKFEASGTKTVNGTEVAVGNAKETQNAEQNAPDSTTFVRSLPNVISWRHINIGESQYRCMQMANNTSAYGWNNVNTHLVRNSEWGAVAYLCYSDYGEVPKTNGCGTQAAKANGSHWYDLYTGMGPASKTSEGNYTAENRSGHEYNTLDNGVLSSTTANVYGVYDMAGGALERVAVYLDNGNGNIKGQGNPPSNARTSNTSIKYFNDSNQLNSAYASYWEKYEVGAEEKSNSIAITGEENLTQDGLRNKYSSNQFIAETSDPNPNEKYNAARKRLTDANYEWLANVKGIGVNEITNKYSYYGVQKSNGQYTYMLSATDTGWNAGRGWNSDYVVIGHGYWPFVNRGGDCNYGAAAGVMASSLTYGYSYNNYGFRPTLCP